MDFLSGVDIMKLVALDSLGVSMSALSSSFHLRTSFHQHATMTTCLPHPRVRLRQSELAEKERCRECTLPASSKSCAASSLNELRLCTIRGCCCWITASSCRSIAFLSLKWGSAVELSQGMSMYIHIDLTMIFITHKSI